jgi:hypothetical protein
MRSLDAHVSEAELQTSIIETARLRRWLVCHQRPARTNQGWRTAITGDPGCPDLVMVKGGRLIFAELKSERGKLTVEQVAWLDRLGSVDGIEVYVWRPSDLNDALEVLR